ncbi:class I tRNA ligase family protein [Haloechinothrix halophila]|uniref:class I tRNA ligase family protein n=1 Tax=Haloechinothrix halophila TaxID=1069073 RepID=UPI0004060227|nr:class I tRNA ligase family protein [Haloechinothrix halophila]
MILNHYDEADLSSAFGIDMSPVEGLEVGAGWGRVRPGVSSTSHQHDETEMFVIVAGTGELTVDGRTCRAGAGTVALFEPFESHIITNTGDEDLVFFTQYWRDTERARLSAVSRTRPHASGRPQFVFSTPPTPNGDLHLGHLSGPYLGADVYVRYQRLLGNRAWHVTGSDDFQSYVQAAAARDGSTPAETARHYGREIAATLEAMDIEVDQFTVTSTDEEYEQGLRRFFSRLIASGWVRPAAGPALVDGDDGQYLYEVAVSGDCPGCSGPTGGNICEECGEPNVVTDLVTPRSRYSESEPRVVDMDRYMLPLHEFADAIAEHYRSGRVPVRLRELARRVFGRDALDLPLSHPATWGVEPEQDELSGQVIWVWPEMSYGFLYGIERLAETVGESWSWDEPEADWKIVHFFGYDNSFYHAILYPALYRLAFPEWKPDIDYHLNEFYLLEGEKFSTSRQHVVWGKEILTPDSVDAVRYYLSSTRPEDERTDFRRADFEHAVAETLVGQWQRWLHDVGERVRRDYDGSAPDAGTWTAEHTAFLARLSLHLDEITTALNPEAFSLRHAGAVLDAIVADARAFSRQQSPLRDLPEWDSEARTAVALELAAARLLGSVSAPLMPRFSGRLIDALGLAQLDAWPDTVALVEPGSACTLAATDFFTAAHPSPLLLDWLRDKVAKLTQQPADGDIIHKSMPALGMSSLAVTTLQYYLLTELKADVPLDVLVADVPLTTVASRLVERVDATVLATVAGEAA